MSESRPFELVTQYAPAGDQPQAIEKLVKGIQQGYKSQLLLGVTGSGKTYTMANVIAQTQRPTIVMAHNKTLAAQLYGEFKAFSPIMPLNTSSVIMTIINQKLMFRPLIPLLKKMRQLMTTLTRCGCSLPVLY